MKPLFVLLFLVVFLAQGCHGGCLNANEVKNMLNEKLKVGDPREKAEEILREFDISFSYDKFSKRYQSTIINKEKCDPYHAISLYIDIDEKGLISKIDVFDSYTMP